MLRGEASNLPNPVKIPRSRRLLPLPPGTRRPTTLPPRPEGQADDRPRQAQRSFHDGERWSVKLELGNEEIAKLYGQGMTRGAVVWRKGMVEWRPLLVTPELSDVLRRTRITLPPAPSSLADTIPPSGVPFDDLTLPRPPRLPYGMLPSDLEERVPVSTLAPMAADVDVPPQRPRRPIELGAVALGAFLLAWMGHAAFSRVSSTPAVSAATMAAMATPGAPPAATATPTACEPGAMPATPAPAAKHGIPTVSVGDLPLVNRGASAAAASPAPAPAPAHAAPARGGSSRASRAAAAAPPPQAVTLPVAPSRTDLVAALSQVARASSGCGERGGPVRVVVSFAGSGVARSIQVSGSDLPAATRSCIIAAASRARVGAFSGDPVTVSKAL
jgi:hypothetical protein